MTDTAPDAYCFFQDIAPRAPFRASFDRDYLLHAVRGALHVEVGAKRWVLPSSFAAWVPAQTDIKVSLDRPVTSCSILSRPGFATGFPAHPVAFQMSRLTREMAQHCRDWGKDDPHPPEAGVFFQALLSTCATLVDKSIDTARPSTDDPGLSKAIAYTEAHLDGPLVAKKVAQAAGLSERSMQRKFAEELGESWAKTVTRIRMIRAIELLSDHDRPVIQVAADCGYASVSAFNQSFKDYAGRTPTEFRRAIS